MAIKLNRLIVNVRIPHTNQQTNKAKNNGIWESFVFSFFFFGKKYAKQITSYILIDCAFYKTRYT